jgi:hypothetical protein
MDARAVNIDVANVISQNEGVVDSSLKKKRSGMSKNTLKNR